MYILIFFNRFCSEHQISNIKDCALAHLLRVLHIYRSIQYFGKYLDMCELLYKCRQENQHAQNIHHQFDKHLQLCISRYKCRAMNIEPIHRKPLTILVKLDIDV